MCRRAVWLQWLGLGFTLACGSHPSRHWLSGLVSQRGSPGTSLKVARGVVGSGAGRLGGADPRGGDPSLFSR